MVRILLLFVLALVVARAFWRVVAGIIVGASAPSPSRSARRGVPERGVQMVRDPVCGTFVIPASALAVRDSTGLHHFCSEKCRQAFLSRVRR